MENIDKNLGQKQIEKFQQDFLPTLAIGELIFFDYFKKKFGFVSVTKNSLNLNPERIFVSETGLGSARQIEKGGKVTFVLNKGKNGFFATNLKSIDDLELNTINENPDLFRIEELKIAIDNSVKYDYTKLTSKDKQSIIKIINRESKKESFNLLIKFGQEKELLDNYITNFIEEFSDEEKLDFLKKSYSFPLLEHTLVNWKKEEKNSILELSYIIRYEKVSAKQIPNEFLNFLLRIDWTFDEILKIYSVLKLAKLKSLAITLFSFNVTNLIEKFKSIFTLSQMNVSKIKTLKSTLCKDLEYLSANDLIKIYLDLCQYKIIEDENQLLKYLIDKEIRDLGTFKLIISLINDSQKLSFKKIIRSNVQYLNYNALIEILNYCDNKIVLMKVLVDEYFNDRNQISNSEHLQIVRYLTENSINDILEDFLEKFHEKLVFDNPLDFLELAFITNHLKSQKLICQDIKFNNENQVESFVTKFSKYTFDDELKNSNRPLFAFLIFMNSSNNFNFTEDFKKFLQINKGIVQCLVVKFLIYQLYKKRINKAEINELLNSFQWTEISALLLKEFIKNSNITDKILLENLNFIFKGHFEILTKQKFDSNSFHNNFTIRNILSTCKSRTHYNARIWSANGITRLYNVGKVTLVKKEKMDCFCEGRAWKREFIWNSTTRQPSNREYDFYWCRNSYCAERNDIEDLQLSYHKWTLSEIALVLNVKIEKIVLATLSGWANKMNEIVKHLKCRKCKEVLRPLPFNPRTLGHNAVPLFQCINDKCNEKKIIRFTSCLNSKCESHKTSLPLDSRDCKTCPTSSDVNHTGLQCNYCGTNCPSCSGNFNGVVVRETW